MKRVAIITSSDTGYRGEREDLSGPAIREIVEKNGYEVVSEDVLPDDRKMLSERMAEIADSGTAACVQHDYHETRHAQPFYGRYPKKNTDHQSSGKSESCKREPGVYY